ncbi:hypothetical protein SVI_1757 [Shewanella violacea DSS12]|uniref:Uncharacterized protein n=1 Tax=Shewanella violacea (strain JCM 10179 / CIP 106290 / LMG 19151 / DSS12) TaxID=637905 RepID=D4ZJ79_SHEVD|nr:hypothetical protein SVI_1757 [Shewanella violacea DSS12]
MKLLAWVNKMGNYAVNSCLTTTKNGNKRPCYRQNY